MKLHPQLDPRNWSSRQRWIVAGIIWGLCVCDWMAWHVLARVRWLETIVYVAVFIGAAVLILLWLRHYGLLAKTKQTASWILGRRDTGPPWTVAEKARLTFAYIPLWQACVFLAGLFGAYGLSRGLQTAGLLTAFFIGLFWVIGFVEHSSRVIAADRSSSSVRTRSMALDAMAGDLVTTDRRWIWDPFDLEAWYYRRRHAKLKQSLLAFASYGAVFLLTVTMFTLMSGCMEIYEMPAGGGEVAQIQKMQIKKVIKKRFVINPFSAMIMRIRKIEEVDLNLEDFTDHQYVVGQGQGAGAGFSGGTNRGKVRFIRLEYNGGDWDQDFGIGADLNMLLQYGIRTNQKVAEKTESRRIDQLRNFPKGKSPPFVYMTGQRNIHLGKRDIETLREYLIDKHGMLFADNGGSRHWHDQFFNLMRKVLPTVKAVKVPLDHQVHSLPYRIPTLPYVVPHGGKDAYGWVHEGRLVAYYHPGDIGDAWSDGNAGVSSRIAEYCYQLGVNVMFYAHAEYNKWINGLDSSE